jgi:DNA mismatch repair protein MutS
MVLLFRVGDFYEAHLDDAHPVSFLCGLTLTKRGEYPMTGFPSSQLERCLTALLRAGLRVAVLEEVREGGEGC